MRNVFWARWFSLALFTAASVSAGPVLVNEIMYHPGLGAPGETGYLAEDLRKEFIELHNSGTTAVNLKGWRFTKGVAFVFPDVSIPAGGFLVISADLDINRFKATYKTNYPAVVDANIVGGWTKTLGNQGDELALVDSQGNQIDSVTYSSEGDWAWRRTSEPYPGQPTWWRGWQWLSGAAAGGKSLELINPAMPNQYGQNWAASLNDGGTPGGPNSVAASHTGPFILDVRHSPAIPKSNELVTVSARVLVSSDPKPTVTLCHRLDGAVSFAESPMFDDGLHGDGGAADGTWAAILPAETDQTTVEFYVKAANASGETRTWPGPTDAQGTQGANALYQVDTSVYAGAQPVYRIVTLKSEWDAWLNLMDNVSNGQYSDATMNATFISVDGIGTEVRYCSGVRNRGAGTRAAHPHNLYVAIPGDHPWRNRTAVALNTRTVHSQVAGNAINVVAGLPNTFGAPVQVRVNGANLAHPTASGGTDGYQFGSYFAFQPYGSEWLKVQYPPDAAGNIYKGVWYFDGHSLRHAADFDYLGEDPAAYREAYSPSGPTGSTGPYVKQSNVSADDWSDLIHLCKVLTQTPDADYIAQVTNVVNIDEWLNYFAVTTLMGNRETTLGTGAGDDYSMYRGVTDPRFQLLPHDMDTTLGQGGSPDYSRTVFEACAIPALNRLLKHPAIAPRYYAILKEQAETTFSTSKISALFDQVLKGWVPDAYINAMKQFVELRRANVLAQIPQGVTIVSDLSIASGFPKTTAQPIALRGTADAIHARSVLVNGVPATWTPWTASWSADGITLNPGINRVVVQALDSAAKEVGRASIDLWYDNGKTTAVAAGILPTDTAWSAAGGPYRLAGSLTIPPGRTLTVEPGTTVYFDPGAAIVVNGRILAPGTPYQRIRFTRPPGGNGAWNGFQFMDARQPNILAYADMEYGDAGPQCLYVRNSQLLIDRMTFFNLTTKYFDLWEPQVTIRHSTFGDLGGTNFCTAEHMLTDGWFVVEGNLFGKNTGDNDIFHLNRVSVKGGAAAQIINNVFTGAGDDLVDNNETDTHLEGNLLMHANEGNAGNHGASAAVTTGPGGSTGSNNLLTQHLTVVRNVFYRNDYGIISKTGASSWIFNNVFVGNRGAIMFDETDRTSDAGPSRAAYIESCIFWNNQPEDPAKASGALVDLENPRAFETGRLSRGQTQVTVNNSILPAIYHHLGAGNLDANPDFTHPAPELDFTVADSAFQTGFDGFDANRFLVAHGLVPDVRLQPGSPARGTGYNGVDMGSFVSTNASISGTPTSPTSTTVATLTVAGLDIHGYKYRLIASGITNDWSRERQQLQPVLQITLSGSTATATCANHGYTNGDWIQILGADALYPYFNGIFQIANVTASAFSYPVTFGTNAPQNQLPPQDLWCRKSEPIQLSALTNGTYTVEVIRKNSLGLWQDEAHPSTVTWTVDTALPGRVRLNEILAHNVNVSTGAGTHADAVELYNAGGQPLDLSGMTLARDVINGPKFVLPSGTTLGAGSYLVLDADNLITSVGLHLGFALNRSGDSLLLSDRNGALLDSVTFGPQLPNLSLGRLPDGPWGLTVPTLGSPNVAQPVADPGALKINEWLTDARDNAPAGFIELYNPDAQPVALGGLVLADCSIGQLGLPTVAPLSFIAAQGFALFYADNQPAQGANHLEFKLSSEPGAIGLFASDLSPIDVVFYGPQTLDVSQGRTPNGGAPVQFFLRPTPGFVNPDQPIETIVTQTLSLIASNSLWKYEQTGIPGSDWITPGYTSDSSWPSGAALLYVEGNTKPWPKNTPLTLGRLTYYFRTHFNVTTNLAGATLNLQAIIDDGAVFYLNGTEVLRLHMPSGPVDYSTLADDHESALEGPFEIPAANLRSGNNVLAAEVHQVDAGSSDIVFGASLDAVISITNSATNTTSINIVLNEILAHNASLTNQAGLVTDWIELFNPADRAVDLAGVSLTDDPTTPRKWVFPANSSIPATGYLVIGSSAAANASAFNTGFGLNAAGGSVFLFDTPDRDGQRLDSIGYGPQVSDLSVGRTGPDGPWTLNRPTPGAPNTPTLLGNSAAVRINEWMANPTTGSDWFELYNPEALPVQLSGLYLTDSLTKTNGPSIPPLSFLGAGRAGYQKFVADGSATKGANHVDFKLSSAGETIALLGTNLAPIDLITFGPQSPGVSQGRYPDGSPNLMLFPDSATPGAANSLEVVVADSDGDGMPDAWETAHGLNPDDPSDAALDSDGDGLTNLNEYLAETDPRDPASLLKITLVGRLGQPMTLLLYSAPGKSYILQYSSTLASDAWQNLMTIQATGAETAVPIDPVDPLGGKARYYRVILPMAAGH